MLLVLIRKLLKDVILLTIHIIESLSDKPLTSPPTLGLITHCILLCVTMGSWVAKGLGFHVDSEDVSDWTDAQAKHSSLDTKPKSLDMSHCGSSLYGELTKLISLYSSSMHLDCSFE